MAAKHTWTRGVVKLRETCFSWGLDEMSLLIHLSKTWQTEFSSFLLNHICTAPFTAVSFRGIGISDLTPSPSVMVCASFETSVWKALCCLFLWCTERDTWLCDVTVPCQSESVTEKSSDWSCSVWIHEVALQLVFLWFPSNWWLMCWILCKFNKNLGLLTRWDEIQFCEWEPWRGPPFHAGSSLHSSTTLTFSPSRAAVRLLCSLPEHGAAVRFVYGRGVTSVRLKARFHGSPSAWAAEVWRHACCCSFTFARGPSPRSPDTHKSQVGPHGVEAVPIRP